MVVATIEQESGYLWYEISGQHWRARSAENWLLIYLIDLVLN